MFAVIIRGWQWTSDCSFNPREKRGSCSGSMFSTLLRVLKLSKQTEIEPPRTPRHAKECVGPFLHHLASLAFLAVQHLSYLAIFFGVTGVNPAARWDKKIRSSGPKPNGRPMRSVGDSRSGRSRPHEVAATAATGFRGLQPAAGKDLSRTCDIVNICTCHSAIVRRGM
jgi:hypothetical protein